MDAACTIQDSIHVFSLVHKYVSRILGTYQIVSFSIFVARKRFIVEYDIFSHSIVIVTKEIDVNNLDVIVAVNKSERMVVNKKERETLITVAFMDTSPESGRTIIFCSISTPQIIKIPKIKL